MKRIVIVVELIFILIFNEVYTQTSDSIYLEGAKKTVRLTEESFPVMPTKIREYLSQNSYTIPQIFGSDEPHNVITGEFIRRGIKDWAVLASKNLKSKIIVFHNGSADKINIIEIAESDDIGFVQGIGDGKVGFSRSISSVGKDFINQHYEWY